MDAHVLVGTATWQFIVSQLRRDTFRGVDCQSVQVVFVDHSAVVDVRVRRAHEVTPKILLLGVFAIVLVLIKAPDKVESGVDLLA